MTTSGVTSTDLYTDIYKDATLYAKWNGIQYTITLDKNGGSDGSLGKPHTQLRQVLKPFQ